MCPFFLYFNEVLGHVCQSFLRHLDDPFLYFNDVNDKVSVPPLYPFSFSLKGERGGRGVWHPFLSAYGIGYILTGTIGTALFLLLNAEGCISPPLPSPWPACYGAEFVVGCLLCRLHRRISAGSVQVGLLPSPPNLHCTLPGP